MTTEREALLPCPFCGEAPVLIGSDEERWAVTCMADDEDCDPTPSTWPKASADAAIAAWNRQSIPGALQAEVERMTTRCESLHELVPELSRWFSKDEPLMRKLRTLLDSEP